MADHIREQILDAVVTKLTGLSTTGTNVYRLRAYPNDSDNLPSLNILQGDEIIIENEQVYDLTERQLLISVEMREKSSSVQLDQTLNQIAKEVTVALTTDRTQGVTGVIDTMEIDTTAPEISDEAEMKNALMTQTWRIYYRTSRTDPSSAT